MTKIKKVLKIPNLVETVKNSLFEGILLGEIRPGEKLQQEKLAESLGVSRQPISHALRLLEEQGILTATSSKSLMVAQPEKNSMLQMMEIRNQLDGFAAGAAAKKFKSGQISRLDKGTVGQIKKLIHRNIDGKLKSVRHNVLDDIKFHELVRDLTGNPYINETLARYDFHHNRFIFLMAKDLDQRTWTEHENIANAIFNADEKTAKKLMAEHIARGTEKLIEFFNYID